jgi:hypothetical protein
MQNYTDFSFNQTFKNIFEDFFETLRQVFQGMFW